VLESFSPGTEHYRDVRTVYYFSEEDLLLRKYQSSSLQVDRRVEMTIELSDLRLNVPLDEGIFGIDPVPDGFQVELFTPGEPKRLLDVGAAAPDWTLPGADGASRRLSSHSGHLVLLEFWGSWCAPCRGALAEVQLLHERYVEDGLVAYGIACSESNAKAPQGVMESGGHTFGLLLDGERVAEAYGVQVYPTLYLIGADGRVLYRHAGHGKDGVAKIEAAIVGALDAVRDAEPDTETKR
jgi:thiol-disulfide isomerase/thioredoxin